MSEETIKELNIGGVEVPVVIPDGHMVTGAVLIVTTTGISEDNHAEEGFYVTTSSMPSVQLVGMLRAASIQTEESTLCMFAEVGDEDD